MMAVKDGSDYTFLFNFCVQNATFKPQSPHSNALTDDVNINQSWSSTLWIPQYLSVLWFDTAQSERTNLYCSFDRPKSLEMLKCQSLCCLVIIRQVPGLLASRSSLLLGPTAVIESGSVLAFPLSEFVVSFRRVQNAVMGNEGRTQVNSKHTQHRLVMWCLTHSLRMAGRRLLTIPVLVIVLAADEYFGVVSACGVIVLAGLE